jgi:hypothetical protein
MYSHLPFFVKLRHGPVSNAKGVSPKYANVVHASKKFRTSVHNRTKSSSHNKPATTPRAVLAAIPCRPKNAHAALMRGDPCNDWLSTQAASTQALQHSNTCNVKLGFFWMVSTSKLCTFGNSWTKYNFKLLRRVGDRPMFLHTKHRSGNSVTKDRAENPLPTEDKASTIDLNPVWKSNTPSHRPNAEDKHKHNCLIKLP